MEAGKMRHTNYCKIRECCWGEIELLREKEKQLKSCESALLATEKCINTQNAWDTVQTARKVVIAHKNLVKDISP